MPIISVILCTYNVEKLISKTIESVLSQSFTDFELLILDNGSVDSTNQIIRQYKDARIRRFHREKNRGYALGLHALIKKSRGEFISLFTGDDLFYPNKLERQIDFLHKNPTIGAVFSRADIIDEQENKQKSHYYETVFNQKNRSRFQWLNYFFSYGNCLCYPTALIRKSIYTKVGYEKEQLAQLPDFDFWVRLCLRTEIHILDDKLVKLRVRSDNKNASADTWEHRVRSMFEFSHVLPHYLSIPTLQDFMAIFPKAQEKYHDITDRSLIPFYVAREALDAPHDFHHRFALDTLFQLLQDPVLAAKIRKKSHFDYPDFIKLTGKYDIHHVQHIQYQTDKIQQMEKKKEKEKERGGIHSKFKNL